VRCGVFGGIKKCAGREFNLGRGANGVARAVSENAARFGLDSDTDGSIRRDAAEFGLVGYKPTYGAVSRFGLIATAGSFDQIGAIAKNVEDAAFLVSAICGYDEKDSTSDPNFTLSHKNLDAFEFEGKKIALLTFENFSVEFSAEKNENNFSFAEKIFAHVEKISIPSAKHALLAHNAIAYAEAASNLSRFDGIRFGHRAKNFADIDSLYTNSRTEGFGFEVQKCIIIGTYLLSSGNYGAYFKKAKILQAMIREEIFAAFEKFDFILTPCADEFFVLANLIGLPAISLKNIHIIGKRFDDENLLAFARFIEGGGKNDK